MLNQQAVQLMFVSPDGKETLSPSLETLRPVIFETDETYWSVGSGDAGLFFVIDVRTQDNSRPLLSFFLKEPHGYFFMYIPPDGWWKVPFKASIKAELVEHSVGGEPMIFPSQCFLSREKAWGIISEFIASQKMSEAVLWVEWADMDFEDPHGRW